MNKETIEEVAEKYVKDSSHELYELRKQCFLDGYKLAQERSYSEEEVLVLLHKRDAYNFKTNAQSLLDWETPIEWLTQFKKKDHEKKYNEIEVIELLQKALTHKDDGETGSLVTAQGQIRTANFYSWFNQFKNK